MKSNNLQNFAHIDLYIFAMVRFPDDEVSTTIKES